jgi:O-glycosyl hydrolase
MIMKLASTILCIGVLNLGAQTVSSETLAQFRLDPSKSRESWGGGSEPRAFVDELLPACFERTLKVNRWEGKTGFHWVFTGPRAGIVVRVSETEVRIDQKFYDSLALTFLDGPSDRSGMKAYRHPEKGIPGKPIAITGGILSVTVHTDYRLGLMVLVNNQEVARFEWMHDLVHHQIVQQGKGVLELEVQQPAVVEAAVTVYPETKHQKILGFGGITCPPAFNQLSGEGKREWWRVLKEYNLLLHREYPMGSHLNSTMDNWDNLADAVPHYYGDNHPNSEVSDFKYLKDVRSHGGKIMFEFWRLPVWARSDISKYAAAMVDYCKKLKAHTGTPPEIVGVQNEVGQKAEVFQQMALSLRRGLDEAGFASVKIHMADNAMLRGGIDWLKIFRARAEVWGVIDYAAVHMYDYQDYFTNPDGYDVLIKTFRDGAGDRAVLSTELCVNSGLYQTDSYRVALQMGQLYHKNMVIMNATAIAYCWLLLNVEQPTYGMTRSLFVPNLQQGGIPVASSHQLRVLGAYSRHIKEGMVRVEAGATEPDLLVSAFSDGRRKGTLVALNRSSRPVRLNLNWPGVKMSFGEVAGPYTPNRRVPARPQIIAPGEFLTLSNVR